MRRHQAQGRRQRTRFAFFENLAGEFNFHAAMITRLESFAEMGIPARGDKPTFAVWHNPPLHPFQGRGFLIPLWGGAEGVSLRGGSLRFGITHPCTSPGRGFADTPLKW
jgi:hypothetical protein